MAHSWAAAPHRRRRPGRELVTQSARVVDEIEREWEAHLGTRGMQTLRRLLARLGEITDY
jgi:hypothetical protein